MNRYHDSVRFLYALGNEVKTIKLGLDRISRLLDGLGRPQDAFQSVHVAGTNGKGSTCAMIESGLRQAGVRTGLYTSPHLVEPAERIQVDGHAVSEAEFADAFDEVHRAAKAMGDRDDLGGHPTYFETVTAMAFVVFRRRRVETAVVEVGLGGRLDATNVVQPALCVITPVDFDHEQWLGSSIEAIAREKAGILKPGVAAIVTSQRREAEAVIEAKARSLDPPARLHSTRDWQVEDVALEARGCRYMARREGAALHIDCRLAGEHQVVNSLSAAAALHHLGVAPAAIESGIHRARWPGRLERVAGSPEVILDGAHNPAGIRALADYIRRFYRGRRVWLIYGTMRDKSVGEIGELLPPLAHEIILTAADSSRALRPEALVPLFDHPRVRTAPTLGDALHLAATAAPADAIFITGSLQLVGEARARFVPR